MTYPMPPNGPFYANDAAIWEQEQRAKAAGYDRMLRSAHDTMAGRFYISGSDMGPPLNKFPHRLNLNKAVTIPDMGAYIRARDYALTRHDPKLPGTPKDWYHDVQKDDDGDRYIYDHTAVHKASGKRVPLDISSNTMILDHGEFVLHWFLGFPTRKQLDQTSIGPIYLSDLELRVFGKELL